MSITQSWNAIYTRRNCEEKVCKMLERKGITYYYAKNQEVSPVNQKKVDFRPLFESVIFVKLPANISLLSLKQLPNITNILYWQQAPAVFPTAEISLLKDFMEANLTVETKKIPLSVNDGFLNLQSQNQHSFSVDNIHTIYLPSIGYCLSAKVEPVANVKLIRTRATEQRIAENLVMEFAFRPNGSTS